jgi:hypothetical protein
MVPQMDEGDVEVLRQCGFMEGEEIHGGVLNSRYAKAERKTGEEMGLAQRRTKEEEEGSRQAEAWG